MPRERISVIMPMYNNQDTVGQAIEAVLAQTVRPYEIIIVNDGSTDRSAEIAARYPVRLINKSNGGESSALNAGIRASKGEFIAIIEADAIVPSNWAAELLKEFRDPTVWGVGAALTTANPRSIISKLAGYHLEWRYAKMGKYASQVGTTNVIYRREVFDRLGLFDESLVNACLDVDLNSRIIASGHKIVLRNDVSVGHFWKASLTDFLKRHWAYAYYRPRLTKAQHGLDLQMTAEAIFTGLFLISLPLLLVSPWFSATALAALAVIELAIAAQIAAFKRSAVPLLYAPVAIIRNVVWLAAYVLGWLSRGKK